MTSATIGHRWGGAVPSVVRAAARQPRVHVHVIRDLAGIVRTNSRLIVEMARHEVTDRFVGSFIGAAWSILHPLIIMAVKVVVFATIFRLAAPPTAQGFDFYIHLISAYLPWMTFSTVLVGGCSSVVNKAGLVKQVVFPVEIIPIKTVAAAMLPQIVGTIFLFAYTLVKFGTVPWTWTLLPVLLVFEVMLLTGLCFFVAALGVFVRDLKELAGVAAFMGMYLTPILYGVEHVEGIPWAKAMMAANPATYYILPFRDACFFGEFRNPWAWVLMSIASVLMLVFGYRVFRKLRPQFGNVL